MSIEELKLALAKARIEVEIAKKRKEEAWNVVAFEESYLRYMDMKQGLDVAEKSEMEADKALRKEALNLHEVKDGVFAGGEISPGVKIKFHHKIKYALEEVSAWAKVNALHLFKFDEAAFKKNPPEGAPFEKYDEPYVEVATDSEDFDLDPEVMRANGIPWTDPMSDG